MAERNETGESDETSPRGGSDEVSPNGPSDPSASPSRSIPSPAGTPSGPARSGSPPATGRSTPQPAALDEEARLRAKEAHLRAYAHLLDSAVRLPGGFRVGLDGLVGLVPVLGDLVGVGLSGYLVVAAARLGIPRSVVARMIANVALESAIGVVPIVGDAFDFFFKANERNVRLLQRELDRRESVRRDASEGA